MQNGRDTGLSLGCRLPGGGHGNASGILAWRIPCTEEPGGAAVHIIPKKVGRLQGLSTGYLKDVAGIRFESPSWRAVISRQTGGKCGSPDPEKKLVEKKTCDSFVTLNYPFQITWSFGY